MPIVTMLARLQPPSLTPLSCVYSILLLIFFSPSDVKMCIIFLVVFLSLCRRPLRFVNENKIYI